MKNDQSGPAFPVRFYNERGDVDYCHEGMTLRVYIATKAMQGELACQTDEDRWHDIDKLAAHCYRVADAMLKASEE